MKKSRAIILLAILLTLVSTFFLFRYIESLRKEPEVQVKYGNIVVAIANIPQHIKITEEMLKVASIPEEAIHPEASRLITDLVGYTTKMEITSGEQILKSKIALDNEKTGLSYQIPENMRAIVVPTSEVTGLAGYLQKGDKVDIIVTYVTRTTPGSVTTPGATTPLTTAPESTTPGLTNPGSTSSGTGSLFYEGDQYIETITQLQNIEVLELGVKEIVDETGQVVKEQGVPSSVTLMVTPQQAEVVAFMLKNGSFQMALRNPVDGVKVPLDHYGSNNFSDWRNR